MHRHRRESGDMYQAMIRGGGAGELLSVRFPAQSKPMDIRGLIFGDCDVETLFCASEEGSSLVNLRRSDE
jgi:hypothetical protein